MPTYGRGDGTPNIVNMEIDLIELEGGDEEDG